MQTIPAGCVPRAAPISTTRHVCQDIRLPKTIQFTFQYCWRYLPGRADSVYIYVCTYLEHSLDDSENDDQINGISGSRRGEDRQDRCAKDSVTDQFHTPYLCAQQTTDKLRRNVSIKERTQNRATKFWAPVEFARLQSKHYTLQYTIIYIFYYIIIIINNDMHL